MSLISALGAACWLGLLTSVSPCLMATNVAAISFLARRVDSPRLVLWSSACYIAGQAVAFVLLAVLVVHSLLTVPVLSHLLQKYMFRLLGPVLILCALFMLEWLSVQLGNGRMKEWVQARAKGGGFWAAAALGIVFAMSFCPTTAALFFGGLIPLSLASNSSVLLALAYALGVALPVAVFSLIIALFTHRVGRVFNQVGRVERIARRGTGLLFLLIGVYFTLRYTLELF